VSKVQDVFADNPLENPADDRLGYAPFAKSLAEAICKFNDDEGLVFALFAPWGSGKTTCLNFIQYYIDAEKEEEKPLIVRFNPWWFSGHGDLLNQFFKEFRAVLGKKDNLKNLINKLIGFGEIISEIPEPTGVGKYLGKILPAFKQIQEKQAWEIKEEIAEEIRKQGVRILIIIDDIDRLSADEIVTIFRVIKAVANFPGTSYLIAFDKSIVVRALKRVQKVSGEDYLEKIIQVPFDMPLPDKIFVRRLFFETLDKVFAGTPEDLFDQTYFGNVFWDGIDHFLKTVRNVKRLTNALKITYPSVAGEVNPVDFMAIETIRIFLPEVYYLIRSNPEMFSGHSDKKGLFGPGIEKIKPFHNDWLNRQPDDDKETVKKLMLRIFPKLRAVFDNTNYGPGWESTWRKQLRICSPDIFPVYFKFAIPEGQISNTEMKAFLALAENVDAFSNLLLELVKQHCLDGKTRTGVFLERMEDYTEQEIPKDHIKNILQSLFDVGDQLLVPEDETRGFFEFGNDVRIGQIMFQLLKRSDTQQERFEILKEVLTNGTALSTIVREISALGRQHGKLGTDADDEKERLVEAQHLEELEQIGLKKIKDAAASGNLINLRNFADLLYRWKEWENEEAPRKWIESDLFTTDEGLVDFLVGFLSKTYIHALGDHVSRSKWRLDPKVLGPFINPSVIIDRARQLVQNSPEWLKDDKKIAVETFVREYDLREKGKDPGLEMDDVSNKY
jgi:predicted KAP-like P-loop ATPase